MTDQELNPTPETEAAAPVIEVVEKLPRLFKVGSAKIVEDDSTSAMTNDQVRDFLKATYPEVANATVREREDGGYRVVEFLPQPGRKG